MEIAIFRQKDSLFRLLDWILKKVKQYIKDQEKEDMMQEKLPNKEYVNPFKGN